MKNNELRLVTVVNSDFEFPEIQTENLPKDFMNQLYSKHFIRGNPIKYTDDGKVTCDILEGIKKDFEEFNGSGICVFLLSYKLKENARICIIDSLEKAKELLKKYGTVMPTIYPESFEEKDLLGITFVLCLDYKKISKDFDVLYTKYEEKNIDFYTAKNSIDFSDWRKQIENDFVPIARNIVSEEIKELNPNYIDFCNLSIAASIVPETEDEQPYILFNKECIDESSIEKIETEL